MEPSLRSREDPDGPAPDNPESTAPGEHLTWAQRSLRMRKWIAVIGVLLCIFVTVLFVRQHAIPEATAFGVIGLISLGYLGWTLAVKSRRPAR
ncbi:MAG: hypothetical protein LC721_08160 [Actinobacteria bacterium]|jgi:hypothetical protein|nr:hypothetical protein [Actinomycetota bacterium]